mmetsp:Transcript_34673/g.101923  ORF Transcript_34673/g.101923 Transcript_34673/m.101923 type:complete len:115 (+) Transcript_34673:833-1177(+)
MPRDILKSSDTAGQMNHIAPAAPGRAHMAYRGAAVAFFIPRVKADAAVPKSGTGMRRSDLVRDAIIMCCRCTAMLGIPTSRDPYNAKPVGYRCLNATNRRNWLLQSSHNSTYKL